MSNCQRTPERERPVTDYEMEQLLKTPEWYLPQMQTTETERPKSSVEPGTSGYKDIQFVDSCVTPRRYDSEDDVIQINIDDVEVMSGSDHDNNNDQSRDKMATVIPKPVPAPKPKVKEGVKVQKHFHEKKRAEVKKQIIDQIDDFLNDDSDAVSNMSTECNALISDRTPPSNTRDQELNNSRPETKSAVPGINKLATPERRSSKVRSRS